MEAVKERERCEGRRRTWSVCRLILPRGPGTGERMGNVQVREMFELSAVKRRIPFVLGSRIEK